LLCCGQGIDLILSNERQNEIMNHQTQATHPPTSEPARQRRRSVLGAVLLLLLLSMALMSCAAPMGATHPDKPCAQFMRNRYPNVPAYDQFVTWSREQRDTLTVEARHDTPPGRLILYRVTCPAEAGADSTTLSGFYLLPTPSGHQHTVIAEDIAPERESVAAIQELTSRNVLQQNGQFITYVFGQVNDPAVQTVEATLDTGEVVQAMLSEHTFMLLVAGQRAACGLRALDAQGAVLAQISQQLPPGAATCPAQ
jgi:hypothetical protein